MSTHSEAIAQAEELERLSNLNLVTFFEKELRRIDAGEYASDLLNSTIIRSLIRLGMLKKSKWRGRGKRGLTLTDRARDLLESQ